MTPAIKPATRRRTLQLFAASAAFAATGAAAPGGNIFRWRGVALGANAEMNLRCANKGDADRLFKAATDEISRLEAIFSLYRTDSALFRLNEKLALSAPPAELLEVLSISERAHRATNGAFDPAVQALWVYHAEVETGAASADAARFEKLVSGSGWRNIAYSADRITLASPAATLTLNGVAQGYVTDRVASLLRAEGMANILINLGEIAAFGRKSLLSPWRIGVAGADGKADEEIALENSAMATSAPLATTFDQAGRLSHIIDPRSGLPGQSDWRRICVIHQSAAVADALSTGITLLSAPMIKETLRNFHAARIFALASDGAPVEFRRSARASSRK